MQTNIKRKQVTALIAILAIVAFCSSTITYAVATSTTQRYEINSGIYPSGVAGTFYKYADSYYIKNAYGHNLQKFDNPSTAVEYAAENMNGDIIVTEGTYNFTTPINIETPNAVNFKGEGVGAVTWAYSGTGNFTTINKDGTRPYITFSGIAFFRNANLNTGTAITANDVYSFKATYCAFYYWNTGITLNNRVWSGEISHNTFSSGDNAVNLVNDNTNIDITNNDMETIKTGVTIGRGDDGVSRGVNVAFNWFELQDPTDNTGVTINAAYLNSITDNYFAGSNIVGIVINGVSGSASDNTITNNKMLTANTGTAISILGSLAQDNTVANNKISNALYGVYQDKGSGTQFSGNTFTAVTGWNVYLIGVEGATMNGDKFRDSNTGAIALTNVTRSTFTGINIYNCVRGFDEGGASSDYNVLSGSIVQANTVRNASVTASNSKIVSTWNGDSWAT